MPDERAEIYRDLVATIIIFAALLTIGFQDLIEWLV